MTTALGLSDIFLMKDMRTKGGCRLYQNVLSVWYREIKEMIDAGLKAFADAADGNKIAEHTLMRFLGISPTTSANERKIVECESVTRFPSPCLAHY